MTKESVTQLIAEIERELPTFSIKKENLEKFGTVDHMDDEYLSYLNGAGGDYVKFLALLIKKLQLKNVVELGNREGLSTLAMYDQLPADARFTSIDIIEDVRYCPDAMFSDKRVSFLTGDVCDVNILKQVPPNIELLFSDTIHYDFQIRDEFTIYQHLLADKALVAIDDIYINDKGKFWNDVTYPKWDLTQLCHHNGWGLFLFERKESLTKPELWLKTVEASSKIWMRKYFETQTKLDSQLSKTVIGRLKSLVKAIPPFYKLLCKINNSYVFYKKTGKFS